MRIVRIFTAFLKSLLEKVMEKFTKSGPIASVFSPPQRISPVGMYKDPLWPVPGWYKDPLWLVRIFGTKPHTFYARF